MLFHNKVFLLLLFIFHVLLFLLMSLFYLLLFHLLQQNCFTANQLCGKNAYGKDAYSWSTESPSLHGRNGRTKRRLSSLDRLVLYFTAVSTTPYYLLPYLLHTFLLPFCPGRHVELWPLFYGFYAWSFTWFLLWPESFG